MTDMTYDQWESLDQGKAIDLATKVWGLRDIAGQAYNYMNEISKHSPADESQHDAWEAACVEASNEYSEAQSDYLEANGEFRDKYGWDLDDLNISDE